LEIKNVTESELYEALRNISVKYDGNIRMNVEAKGNHFKVNLRVISAKAGGKGRKLNQSFVIYGKGIRANGSACWHVHGDFFDVLLDIQPKAIIKTMMTTIYKDEYGQTRGNWQDKNIGSIMNPINYSEACECT
jgi:hypothetical protein